MTKICEQANSSVAVFQYYDYTRSHMQQMTVMFSHDLSRIPVQWTTAKLCSSKLITYVNIALNVQHHATVKIATEFRNAGDTAYAMNNAAAEAYTQWLAAGRGHGYQLAAPSLQPECGTGSGPAC